MTDTGKDLPAIGFTGGFGMETNIIYAGVLISLFLLISPISAATEKVILYQTDFSSSPNWTTNNPSRYYWDETAGMYHYYVEGGTNGYASFPLSNEVGSFVLEYDLLPVRTDKDSAFRLGVTGSSDMNINKGPSIFTEFSNKKSGPSMWLRTVTQNNNLHEIGSLSSAYPGETKTYEDNTTYHITVRYQKDRQTIDIKINERKNNTPIWGYYLKIDRELNPMDRLVISSVGDYGNIGKSAEGFVDNISLYTYRDVSPPVTSVTPEITMPPPTTNPVNTAPTTVVPATTTAALSPFPPLLAASFAGLLLLYHRRNG
jgi:hypothetical protein